MAASADDDYAFFVNSFPRGEELTPEDIQLQHLYDQIKKAPSNEEMKKIMVEVANFKMNCPRVSVEDNTTANMILNIFNQQDGDEQLTINTLWGKIKTECYDAMKNIGASNEEIVRGYIHLQDPTTEDWPQDEVPYEKRPLTMKTFFMFVLLLNFNDSNEVICFGPA